MPLFRCQSRACKGRDFEADGSPCPACGNPAPLALVTVHFDPPHPRDPRRRAGVLACQPSRGSSGVAASAEPAAVNCPRCRLADTFPRAFVPPWLQ